MRRRRFLLTCAAASFAATPEFALAADARPRYYSRARLVWPDGKPVRTAALPAHINFVFHYPFAATPCFLLNLGRRLEAGASLRTADARTYRWQGGVGPERSIAAYSAICAHKMSHPTRQISFISYRAEGSRESKRSRVIHCCSEHSEFDPAQGAAVVRGPARQPLAAILLDYDEQADELYAVGTLGGEPPAEFQGQFSRHCRENLFPVGSSDILEIPGFHAQGLNSAAPTGVRTHESADELVVLAMRTNPEPMDAVCYREPECPVVEADPDAAILAVSNRLEVQRRVRRIGLELSVVPVREGLNAGG